jgi:hypothetical protein
MHAIPVGLEFPARPFQFGNTPNTEPAELFKNFSSCQLHRCPAGFIYRPDFANMVPQVIALKYSGITYSYMASAQACRRAVLQGRNFLTFYKKEISYR